MSHVGRARRATGLSVPHWLQHLGFILPGSDREAAVTWVFGRCRSPKGCCNSGTLCVGRASPRKAQHTAAAAAKLLRAARANAGVRNKPPPTANGPPGLSAQRATGVRHTTDPETAAALLCELGLPMPPARGQLPLKAGTPLPAWLLGSAGHSCALVPGRGAKGREGAALPSRCLCCVYQSPSNPAEESSASSTFTACPAAEPPGTRQRRRGGGQQALATRPSLASKQGQGMGST